MNRPPHRSWMLGRRAECDAVDRLLADVLAGQGRVLVLRGEAGVGKTALLHHVAEAAAGSRVARAAGVQSEMELPFAGLHQLCAPIFDSLNRIPGPQRDALRVAFGMQDGGSPSHFLVALAALSLLADAAEARPLVCLVEAVDRVKRAGGQVLALDVGQVTNGNAGQWLSGTMLGAVSEYQRRTAAERSREAQARAIARGVAPWPNIPPGYVRGADGRLVVDEAAAAAVKQAFALRADGATIAEVRAHLAAHGIERSYHGVTALLGSRIVLGEIHFGDYEPNLSAHPAIVDRDTWLAVQRASVTRGRKPKSQRLLARLGVLRCASCGGRMVVGTQTSRGRTYPFYRCGHVREDCSDRVTISAELVEQLTVDAVKDALADVEGRASAQSAAREAEATLQRAQAALDAAIRAFAGMEDEDAARERLLELRAARDDAQERVDRLGGDRAVLVMNAADDWDRLTIDAQRALIRATVEQVMVAPGRGADRVTVELFGQ